MVGLDEKKGQAFARPVIFLEVYSYILKSIDTISREATPRGADSFLLE